MRCRNDDSSRIKEEEEKHCRGGFVLHHNSSNKFSIVWHRVIKWLHFPLSRLYQILVLDTCQDTCPVLTQPKPNRCINDATNTWKTLALLHSYKQRVNLKKIEEHWILFAHYFIQQWLKNLDKIFVQLFVCSFGCVRLSFSILLNTHIVHYTSGVRNNSPTKKQHCCQKSEHLQFNMHIAHATCINLCKIYFIESKCIFEWMNETNIHTRSFIT